MNIDWPKEITNSFLIKGASCCRSTLRLVENAHGKINSRFFFSPSPSIANTLFVIGTISHKQTPFVLGIASSMPVSRRIIQLGCPARPRNYSCVHDLSELITIDHLLSCERFHDWPSIYRHVTQRDV